MKKRKFNSRAMKEFAEPKVVHESKPVDLITQFNRMRSIAADIYNSDFYMNAAKAKQKKIEASIACISATMISMIGMEAIKNSHDCLPDDSGDGNDTDSHDAKYPMQILDDDPSTFDNEYDEVTDDDSDGDEVKDYSEVNLGNFADGPFYSDRYRALAIQYCFDTEHTLKQIEKLASYYYIQMINLVDVVDSMDEIAADKYTLEPGSVFFITNKKDSSKSPVFILIYAQPYTKTRSSDINRFSLEIAPERHTKESTNSEDLEESPKTNHVDSIGSEAYFDIGELYLGQNTIIDLNATWEKIKEKAKEKGIKTITFVDTIKETSDIYSGKYSLKPGSLFFAKECYPRFILINESPTTFHYIDPVLVFKPFKKEDSVIKSVEDNSDSDKDDIEFIGIDDYADGNVRIAKDLKNIISIDYNYNIKEICEKRNYDYEKMISCLKAVTAIIGGGMHLTFEGTVDSLKSIVTVDPMVAYDTCSVFFVSAFIDGAGPYFVIYMPITGKTKNGYSFRLYRIRPILKQDPNTDSQDDSNVREINQFTAIYRANLEVSEADKDAYMKVEFSLINHSANRAIDSLQNICYTWKFKFYDTIKRIRFVAYMNNLKEIKFAGTACSHEEILEKEVACSHEEILEKEVLYSNGSVLFVSDEEDPHFVIVEFYDGSTCLNRINPVKE